MKKRIIIGELEKQQIRTMHESFKKTLKESSRMINEGLLLLEDPNDPVPTGDALIDKIKSIDPSTGKAFCSVAENASDYTLNDKKKALFKIATTTGKPNVNTNQPKYVPGDKLIIKSDYTYDVYNGAKWDATPQIFEIKGTYKWKCPALMAQQRADQSSALTAWKNQGWKTYQELANPNLASNTQYYKQVSVDDGKGSKITLYMETAGALKPGIYPAGSDQDNYLKELEAQGLTVSPQPGGSYTAVSAPNIPGFDIAKMFPNGLQVYRDNSKANTYDAASINNLVQGMTPQEQSCFGLIDNYLFIFPGGDNPMAQGQESNVANLKGQVQACQNAYNYKWETATQTPPREPGALAGRNKKQEYATAKTNYDKIIKALNILKLFRGEVANFEGKSAPGRKNQTWKIPKI